MKPVTRETFIERRQTNVRWSALVAGALVAIALWVALQMLGVGVGLAAGVSATIAPLVALFVGGFVAARAGSLVDRGVAAIHGGVLWALTVVLGVVLMTWTVDAVVGAAGRGGGPMMGPAGDEIEPARRHMRGMGWYPRRTAWTAAEADRAGEVLLGAGIALLLGLGGSIGGAVLGARRRDRGEAGSPPHATTVTTPVVPPPAEPVL
jgi:hypothetical protein